MSGLTEVFVIGVNEVPIVGSGVLRQSNRRTRAAVDGDGDVEKLGTRNCIGGNGIRDC